MTAALHPPPAEPTDSDGGGGSYERITVNLTRRTSDALANASRATDANKTDVVNKAIVVYDMLLRVQAKTGGVIYIRDGDGADLERLRLL